MTTGDRPSRLRARMVALVGSLVVVAALGACSGSDDESTFAGAASETTSTTTSVPSTSSTVVGAGGATAGGGNQTGPSGGGGGGGGAPAPSEQYVVPNLVGQPLGAAEALLSARGLRSLYVVVSDWKVARDVVSSQDQPAGAVLGPGGVVSFRVSSGPTTAPVPNVVGQCVAAARDRLSQAGFPSQVFYRADGAVKYYRVISSSPGASMPQMQGSLVTLYVSTNVARDGCS